jgi:hypothetical protein
MGHWDPDTVLVFGREGIAGSLYRVPGFGVGINIFVTGGVVLLERDAEFVAATLDDMDKMLRIRGHVCACSAQANVEVI